MKLFRGLTVVSLVAVTVSACGFLKKGGADAGDEGGAVAAADEAGAATTPPPAAGAAANEQDVARFPDETNMNNATATVRRPYNVRDTPPAGGIVGGVNPGQAVTQIASRTTFMLITFDDKASGKKLMGWVHKDAFLPPVADAGIPDPKCTAPESPLVSDNVAFCGQTCSTNADCASGNACRGTANRWDKGKAGEQIKVCVVYQRRDGGSALTSVDSGATPTAVDAGAAPALPAQTAMIAPPTNGKCPDNASLVKKDNQCHIKCPQAKVCDPFKGYCGKCDGVAVCNTVRNFCAAP